MSACRLARDTNAAAIIGVTRSGYTSFRLSHHRPKASLLIFTSNRAADEYSWRFIGEQKYIITIKIRMLRRMILIEDIKLFLIEKGELKKGDVFINTLSMPVSNQRKTNAVKLSVVE